MVKSFGKVYEGYTFQNWSSWCVEEDWVESGTSWSLEGETKRGKWEEKPLENQKYMNWTVLNVINSITQLNAHTE